MPRRLPEVLLSPRQRGLRVRTARIKDLTAQLSSFMDKYGESGNRVAKMQAEALAHTFEKQSADLLLEAQALAAKGRKKSLGSFRRFPKKVLPVKRRVFVPQKKRLPLRTAAGFTKRPFKKIIRVRRSGFVGQK